VDGVVILLAAAAEPAAHAPNLWGALGCAVAYAAALFATLDAFADFILARAEGTDAGPLAGVGLKFGSKVAAAAIAVVTAAIVLALDQNWFAFTTLTIAFCAVVAIGLAVLLRQPRTTRRRAH
jgi:hypothetical protein